MSSVCIIGAGMAGLCAAKYSAENNLSPSVYEQTNEIGGTWVFTNQTVKDEFGLDIHSSMYKSLRTNLPKEIMGYHDFPMPNNKLQSYVPADDVLKFLHTYCEEWNLIKFIKFRHHVMNVEPQNQKWIVKIKNLLKNEIEVKEFDFIIVCNGHYSEPRYPIISGLENFKGKQLHSHQFRRVEDFKDDDVLIIGAGPSGRDIANELAPVSQSVTISHHAPEILTLPENVFQVSDIKKIENDLIQFNDETCGKYSAIIFCTGYYYKFPFLSSKCGITVDDNFVQPLYKQCVNINFPTMAFIGLPFRSLIAQMIDLQVRFIMEFYTGRKIFPSKSEMLQITKNEMNERWAKGWKKSNAHMLAKDFRSKYYCDLAETAGIENIKPVMEKLIQESNLQMKLDIVNFRNHNYRIIDDENFEEI